MARNGSGKGSGSGKESDLVRQMRRTIPRAQFIAWGKEDRVVQLTRLRDAEEQGGDMWHALNRQLETEVLGREQAQFSAMLARQDNETLARYAQTTAYELGPTRSRRVMWLLGDLVTGGLSRLSWTGAPFRFAIRRSGICLSIAFAIYMLELAVNVFFTELGGNSFLMLLAGALGLCAYGVAAAAGESEERRYWRTAIVAWIVIAGLGGLVWANMNWKCFGPGDKNQILVVRDQQGQVVRAELMETEIALIKPIQWWKGERVTWYNPVSQGFTFKQPLVKGKGELIYSYVVRLKLESLKAGYQPTDDDLQRVKNAVAEEVLRTVKTGPPTNSEQAWALSQRLKATFNIAYRVEGVWVRGSITF